MFQGSFKSLENCSVLIEQLFGPSETFITLCTNNGSSTEEINKLKDLYKKASICISSKEIFITPKEEFINHISKCTKNAITETKKYLRDEEKYYPSLMVELATSIVSNVYDYQHQLQDDFPSCLNSIAENLKAQNEFNNCLDKVQEKSNAIQSFPTKPQFCSMMMAQCKCFTKLLETCCSRNKNMIKFGKDCVTSIRKLCEK